MKATPFEILTMNVGKVFIVLRQVINIHSRIKTIIIAELFIYKKTDKHESGSLTAGSVQKLAVSSFF